VIRHGQTEVPPASISFESKQSLSSEFFSVSKSGRALVQVWLTDCPIALEDNPCMLRATKHCKDLVFAGDLAAVTYAEANLPSFLSGENGCMIGMLSNIVLKFDCLPHMIACCIRPYHVD